MAIRVKAAVDQIPHKLKATLVSALQLTLCSSGSVRVLVDTVLHFPPSLEEVTVSVSDERMWVRNHVEEHGTLVF